MSPIPKVRAEEAWQEVAISLRRVGALKFGDFTLTSGKKSPYYIDLRLVYSHPEVFDKLAEMCVDMIKREIGEEKYKLAGVPISGLPLAALVSYKLNSPLLFVRKERKMHGGMKRVEGLLERGDRVILIDDLVTTGGSICDAAEAIRNEGGEVEHAAVILDREEGAREVLEEHGIDLHACIRISDVVRYLCDVNLMDEERYRLVMDHLKRSKSEKG
ncbi:MAG: orotate phosphoribosyltransferase [Hadesarchaea archaeon]|nr:orotate phosphoribosyltransferase [Hadesarchaea archaeon]